MMQIEISGSLERLISDAVSSGEFKSPEEYIKMAINNFRIQRLDEELKKGYQDIENGDFIKVTDIGEYFRELNKKIDSELGYPT